MSARSTPELGSGCRLQRVGATGLGAGLQLGDRLAVRPACANSTVVQQHCGFNGVLCLIFRALGFGERMPR